MAITRAQQVRQMLREGSMKPAMQGGGPNYLGKQPEVTVPRKWKSSPDHPDTELAYITEPEKKVLIALNMHGGLEDGKPNKGPKGVMSLQGDLGGYDASPGGPDRDRDSGGQRVGQADKNKQRAKDIMTGKVATKTTTPYRGPSGDDLVQLDSGDFVAKKDLKNVTSVGGVNEPFNFMDIINPSARRRQLFNLSLGIPGSRANITKKRKAYADYLKSLGITPSDELLDTEDLYSFFDKQAFEKNLKPADAGMEAPMSYGDFILERFGSPGVKFSGDVGNKEVYVKGYRADGSKIYDVREKRDDGPDPIIFPQDMEDNTGDGEGGGALPDDPDDDTNTGGLALRFRKDGGRINAMDGGMMSPEGGIMDLETGRQMYFLGKLVKKATRAVKKIVKSPIGKAALAFGAFKFGPQLLTGEGLGLGKTKAFKDLIFFGKDANVNPMRLAGLASIAPLLFGTGEEEEEDQTIDRGPGLDIAGIRNNPYDFLGTRFAADGGIMRTGYQQGSKEPVAKKTMPLLDMGGKEMDLRENGGFVPIGRMERADDVPARLSKNEFVFTADAVRNAGEGDVDKGAEVMYNMMKNLESGGEVSEESQGLQGAREMFQTSKRLEEVL